MSAQTFAVDDRVMWSTGRGCPGTVESREGWRYPEDLERFPNDVVVKWDDGMHSLVSPGALMPAPTDPSTGAVTAPTPAPVGDTEPSLVALDRQDALVQQIRTVLYHRPYADLGWRPDRGRFETDDAASEHLARMIAEAIS